MTIETLPLKAKTCYLYRSTRLMFNPPPRLSPPPAFRCPSFHVNGAGPSGLGSDPLPHCTVDAGVAADLDFPPAVSGTVPSNHIFPPTSLV